MEQSVNGRSGDVQLARGAQRRQGAVLDQRLDLCPLAVDCARTAKVLPLLPGSRHAGPHPLRDQAALELRHGDEHVEDQIPDRRRSDAYFPRPTRRTMRASPYPGAGNRPRVSSASLIYLLVETRYTLWRIAKPH